ncbi:hypothetical protein Tco_0804500 [Tanacetum coccineum]|uniref:Uncharacterized protein n=1 Tax=Tanacetum coccineum TaxID=301880 RepID=A0ABQ5A5H7_9ASTR
MMKGSDIGIQDKKAKFFNEWERFTSTDGESIESYYHCFLKLMNDFKRNKNFQGKIASNLKFLNNLQPEWRRHAEVNELRAERLARAHYPLALMNLGVQKVGNQNGLIVIPGIANPNANQNRNGIVIASRAEDSVDNAPVYESDGSTEVHHSESYYDNDIFNMFTQDGQYTKLLQPILKPYHVQQNDNNVISTVSSMGQSRGIVYQNPAASEETRALYDSLYNKLAIEVEKVNMVNHKMKETNAELTTEPARYKNQEKCFEINQEKYDKLERYAARRRQSVENVQTYTRRSRLVSTVDVSTDSEFGSTAGVKAENKGKAIMQECEAPKNIKRSSSSNECLMRNSSERGLKINKQFKAEHQQEKSDFEIALELQKQLDEREEVVAQAHNIDWSNPVVLRYNTLQNRPFSVAEAMKNIYKDIRPIFERVWDQNQDFVPKDSDIEKKQPARGSRKKSLARKRARETLSEESAKKQKLEDDTEKEELQVYLNIVPEEESLNIESLATKQDVMELYRLVKERFQTASPEGYDLLLWGDLKTMIEPNEEDKIRHQQDWNLIN